MTQNPHEVALEYLLVFSLIYFDVPLVITYNLKIMSQSVQAAINKIPKNGLFRNSNLFFLAIKRG